MNLSHRFAKAGNSPARHTAGGGGGRGRILAITSSVVFIAALAAPVPGHAETRTTPATPKNPSAVSERGELQRAIAATVKASSKNFTFVYDYQEDLPLTIRVQHPTRWEWSTVGTTERMIGNTQYSKLPELYVARAVLAKRPKAAWYRTQDNPVRAPQLATLVGPLFNVVPHAVVTRIAGGYQVTYRSSTVLDETDFLSSYRALNYFVRLDSRGRISTVTGTESGSSPDGAYTWDAAVALSFWYTPVTVMLPSAATVVDVDVAERWPALPVVQASAIDVASDAVMLAARNRRAVSVGDILEAVNGVELPESAVIGAHSKGVRITDGGLSYCAVVSDRRAVAVRC